MPVTADAPHDPASEHRPAPDPGALGVRVSVVLLTYNCAHRIDQFFRDAATL